MFGDVKRGTNPTKFLPILSKIKNHFCGLNQEAPLVVANMKTTVSVRAYSKVLLHACKYPHKALNGVFLADSSYPNEIHIVDAMPLFHQCLGLAPMLEVALAQVWYRTLIIRFSNDTR